MSGRDLATDAEVAAAIARDRDLPIADVVRLQQLACIRVGSARYGQLLGDLADDVDAGGVGAEILEPHREGAMADAIPLRLLGAVHRIVLQGRAPDLAAFYPSAGGHETGDAWPAFRDVLDAHRAEIEARMGDNVQTNEVGRAYSLLGGFHEVSRATGLPLRTLEVGSSGGLLQHWDRYRYSVGDTVWGGEADLGFADGFVRDEHTGNLAVPELDPRCRVAARGGCDVHPIDVATDEGVLTLRSFLWPDQTARRARLDAAIAVARRHGTVVDRADAGEWAEAQLAVPVPGTATVLHHSIVLQYLPRRSFERLRAAVTTASEAAPDDAPVYWLRMEPAGDVADLRLWHRGEDRVLGTTGYHGPPIRWAG